MIMRQFNKHFNKKFLCIAKSAQAVDENMKLEKCAALNTLNLGESALSKANVRKMLKPLYAIYWQSL